MEDRSRRLTHPLAFWLSLAAALPAHAQSRVPVASPAQPAPITFGQSVIALSGPWKFHTGDSPPSADPSHPLWASPAFDDAPWETVDLTPQPGVASPQTGQIDFVHGWTSRGHPGYWGYAWYRLHIPLAEQPGSQLALEGPAHVDDIYQVFANGTLLGTFGEFPQGGRTPVAYFEQPRMFLLPPATPGASTLFAFRVWMEPGSLQSTADSGGMHTAPQLGLSSVIERLYQLAWLAQVRTFAFAPLLTIVFLVLALLTLSVIFLDRTDRVYLWLTAVFLLRALSYAEVAAAAYTPFASLSRFVIIQYVLLSPPTLFGWLMVWWFWFRQRRPPWLPRFSAVLLLAYMVSSAFGRQLFFAYLPPSVGQAFNAVSIGLQFVFLAMLAFVLLEGIRTEGREGWLTLPGVILLPIALFQDELTIFNLHPAWLPATWSVFTAADVALVITMFGLLLRRLVLSLRRQREMALDVKQAQEVQHVLVPEIALVPGLTIHTEYRPAREVGGDFFQIIPDLHDGSVLILAGDVTGKGLQAGMLVALLVGALRTAAESTLDPLAILDVLNRRLLGRSDAYATCLALRIEPNGHVTLANAGHLAPYLNGTEVEMAGALPLGMIADPDFTVSHFHFSPGQTLTLISDGILEAQNKEGELFGFDRVRHLLQSNANATTLADQAQAFGQTDDISVVSLTHI